MNAKKARRKRIRDFYDHMRVEYFSWLMRKSRTDENAGPCLTFRQWLHPSMRQRAQP